MVPVISALALGRGRFPTWPELGNSRSFRAHLAFDDCTVSMGCTWFHSRIPAIQETQKWPLYKMPI